MSPYGHRTYVDHNSSLWRPVNGPVENFPLAMCDGRTVSPTARVQSDRIRRKYTGGTTFVLQESEQRWYYLSHQKNNEVTIFKNFDSDYDMTQGKQLRIKRLL